LPLIYLLERGSPAQRKLIQDCILENHAADLPAVQAEIAASGALDYTRAAAAREIDAARFIVEDLPRSPYRSSLLELCRFAVQREY